MKKVTAGVSLVLIALLAMPQSMFAQVTPDPVIGTWEGLKAVPPGDELVINIRNGKTLKGRMSSISDTELTMARGKKTTEISRTDVLRVYRLIPKSAKRSSLIGTGIGAGAGAVTGAVYNPDKESGEHYDILVFAGLGAAIGALVGAIFGGRKNKVLIYGTK